MHYHIYYVQWGPCFQGGEQGGGHIQDLELFLRKPELESTWMKPGETIF